MLRIVGSTLSLVDSVRRSIDCGHNKLVPMCRWLQSTAEGRLEFVKWGSDVETYYVTYRPNDEFVAAIEE